MRTRRLLSVSVVAILAVTLVSGAALAKNPKRPAAPKNLRGFLLKPNEPFTQIFPRTPAFAWSPVRGARCYEFELATSRTFSENAIVWSNVRYGIGQKGDCQAVPADSGPTTGSATTGSTPSDGSTASSGTTTSTSASGTPAALIQPLRVPAVSIDVALPWFTGQPYALYARARAVTSKGPTSWSRPFSFNMRWSSIAAPMKTRPGLVRWTPVAGATGYQVWFPEIGKSLSSRTNVADLRDLYTFHRADPGWWSTAKWRVRAVRRVFGTIPNGLPAVSYGPWSPAYRAVNPPLTSGPLKIGVAISDRVSDKRKASAHELMPALTFSGSTGLDGRSYSLFRVYASTDRDCVNTVFRGSVVGSPAFAPRTTGPLALPADPSTVEGAAPFTKVIPDATSEGATYGADWRSLISSESKGDAAAAAPAPPTGTTPDESLTLLDAHVDLPDIDFPNTRYFWTVVPVTLATSPDGAKTGYVDVETPQDACASGRVASFGKESRPVTIGAGKGSPFVAGLTPNGRLLANSSPRPTVFSTPLVAWLPATGATAYEVQWSKARYPWKPVGTQSTFATSMVLNLAPGKWYYRVRGLNQTQLRKAEMTWSSPVPVKVAMPKFSIAR